MECIHISHLKLRDPIQLFHYSVQQKERICCVRKVLRWWFHFHTTHFFQHSIWQQVISLNQVLFFHKWQTLIDLVLLGWRQHFLVHRIWLNLKFHLLVRIYHWHVHTPHTWQSHILWWSKLLKQSFHQVQQVLFSWYQISCKSIIRLLLFQIRSYKSVLKSLYCFSIFKDFTYLTYLLYLLGSIHFL